MDEESISDRLESISGQLEHLDEMVHEIHQAVSRALPLLDRFTGNPVADYLRKRRKGTTGAVQ
jgi:hypothetical protein